MKASFLVASMWLEQEFSHPTSGFFRNELLTPYAFLRGGGQWDPHSLWYNRPQVLIFKI